MSHQLTRPPVVEATMLIRRPAADVFEAFIDPAITTRFWFTKSSGRLEAGRRIRWDWGGVGHAQVNVKAVEKDRRILIEWGPEQERSTTVEWLFTPTSDDATIVAITNSGFNGSGDEVVKQALDSAEGFAMVLAGAKALLEHGIELNLVPDGIAAFS